MELTADGIEAELRELRSRLAGAGAERASDAAADAVNSAQLTALGALLNTHADVRAIALRAGTGELARLREGVDQFDQQVSEQHAAVQAANTQLQVRDRSAMPRSVFSAPRPALDACAMHSAALELRLRCKHNAVLCVALRTLPQAHWARARLRSHSCYQCADCSGCCKGRPNGCWLRRCRHPRGHQAPAPAQPQACVHELCAVAGAAPARGGALPATLPLGLPHAALKAHQHRAVRLFRPWMVLSAYCVASTV